jgi:hypothetical protein
MITATTLRCALLAAALSTGCAVWRPLPGGGFAGTGSDHLDHARVVLRDGTRTEITDVTISRDSIIGFRRDRFTRFAVARTDAASVEAWQPSAPKSFAAGALLTSSVLAVLIVTMIILLSGEDT